ncbi:hypothetical protein AGMMS50222_10990 [Endomicrobiia bacterium]|nr:hypothetical protein AGMMS49556_08810 [Endomicrobiia bacterium]GHT77526.1 hypothetical protein AGMMS50222_10990 [Endomicrobiia bacterium]
MVIGVTGGGGSSVAGCFHGDVVVSGVGTTMIPGHYVDDVGTALSGVGDVLGAEGGAGVALGVGVGGGGT